MGRCSFERLVSLLDEKLDLDRQMDVLDHIGRCDICHEAVYSIIRDRDSGIYGREPNLGNIPQPDRCANV